MSHLVAVALGAPIVAAVAWVTIILYLNMILPEEHD